MSTGAVIVAAGLSSRMGDFKPMMPFENTTISKHVVQMLQIAGADPIVMVTGYRAEELEEHLSETGIRFARNENYRNTQMFDSIKIGIHAIEDECEKIMLLPVDTPAISLKTIRQELMIDADMVRTLYAGRPGHPILLRTEIAKELCDYQGEGGLKGAMENSGFSITNLHVDDKGVNWDVDTQKEYQELIRWYDHRANGYPIRPQVMVGLARCDLFFTPLLAQLIEYIDRTESIQEACLELEVSYTKGSRLIKQAEKELGFKLLERWSGGNAGGGSRMTDEARQFIDCYRRMVINVQSATDQFFQEYFGEEYLRGLHNR